MPTIHDYTKIEVQYPDIARAKLGITGTGTALTIEGEGEIGIS